MTRPDHHTAGLVLARRKNTGIQVARGQGGVEMDAAALAHEATRYLETIHLVQSLGLDVSWRSEAEEIGPLGSVPEVQRARSCECCGGPLVRINGRSICLRP
jgi:hypothetical protein